MITTSLLSTDDEEIIISDKLGIIAMNYDQEISEYNKDNIHDEMKYRKYVVNKYPDRDEIREFDLREIFNRNYFSISGDDEKSDESEESIIEAVSCYLICVLIDEYKQSFLKYKNENINNPTCEPCFEDKFLGLYNFLEGRICDGSGTKSKEIDVAFSDSPNNHDNSRILSSLDWKSRKTGAINYMFDNYAEEFQYKIGGLKQFGQLIDNFLETENDFYALDYIIDVIYHKEDYGAFPIVKLFSIIELIIVNSEHSLHSELKKKLLRFVPDKIGETEENKCRWISLIYKIRNKIAHGDFIGVNKEIQKYMEDHMTRWNLDLYEFSEINWGYSGVVSDLYNVVSQVIWAMITNKDEMYILKNS